jgi:putative ABC transport system permease protein
MNAPTGLRGGGLGARLARRWVRLCTAGLPAAIRERRRAEIDSEIWEQKREAVEAGLRPAVISARLLAGVFRGTLDDLKWRREERAAARRFGSDARSNRSDSSDSDASANHGADDTADSNEDLRARGTGSGFADSRSPNRGFSGGGRFRRRDPLLQDLRFGARSLRRDPWFAAVAVLCLALGIGANTAIFSVVHGVLLRALPFPEADQLVIVREYQIERGMPVTWAPGASASYPNFLDWAAQANVFQGIAASASGSFLMLGAAEPFEVRGAPVTANLFEVLGVRAALGRTLLSGDTERVIVLSDELWRRAFGADPTVVGRTVLLDDTSFEIVGILPPGSMPRTFAEFWTPIEHVSHRFLPERNMRMVNVIGRLQDGMPIDRAEADLRLIAERLRLEHPEANGGYGLQLVPLHEYEVGRVRSTLLLLLGAVGLLLLIACVNVANLLLARLTSRQREVAVRSALGAGRWRIARQLLAESTMLSLLGAGAGLLVAYWSIHAIRATSPGDIPRLDEVGIDLTVLAFTFAVALLTGWLFGLAPAMQASRGAIAPALHRGGRSMTGAASGSRLRGALVIVEVAVALVLLLGAGLLVNSFRYLWSFEPGFDPRGVLTVRISPDRARYPEAVQRDAFFQELYERLRALPQVEAVGGGGRPPVGLGVGEAWLQIVTDGAPAADEEEPFLISFRPISGDYFEALRIPFVAGRPFAATDTEQVIVNEQAASALWPGSNPLGRRLKIGRRDSDSPWLEVIGVVGGVRYSGLDPWPRPELYVPHAQPDVSASFGGMAVVLRTDRDPLALVPALRDAVRAIDPEQPIGTIQTMEEMIFESMARPRFYMALFGLFGAVALALSAAGIFGVASYSVTQRTHEVGVRMALGARRGDVLKLIIGHGAVLTAIGVLIGLATARALTRYVESLLYGITPNDPSTFASVPLLLTAVALIAFWIPARRAAAVDPIIALRRE